MSRCYDRNGKPIELMEWARRFDDERERVVDHDLVGDAAVSTVWLGLDHQFGSGPPLIFETMIFGGPHDEWEARYSTEDEARTGHALAVTALREGREP